MWAALTSDPTFSGLIPASKVVSTTGLDVVPVVPPFAVIRWGTVTRTATPAVRRELTLWVYDRPGSYLANIEPALKAARAVMDSLPGRAHGDGHIIGVDWLGDSADLYDDIYQCAMRNGTWEVVGTGT